MINSYTLSYAEAQNINSAAVIQNTLSDTKNAIGRIRRTFSDTVQSTGRVKATFANTLDAAAAIERGAITRYDLEYKTGFDIKSHGRIQFRWTFPKNSHGRIVIAFDDTITSAAFLKLRPTQTINSSASISRLIGIPEYTIEYTKAVLVTVDSTTKIIHRIKETIQSTASLKLRKQNFLFSSARILGRPGEDLSYIEQKVAVHGSVDYYESRVKNENDSDIKEYIAIEVKGEDDSVSGYSIDVERQDIPEEYIGVKVKEQEEAIEDSEKRVRQFFTTKDKV